MDAITLLKTDHEKVKGLFAKVEAEDSPIKGKALFTQIYHELSVHAIVEEQIFYPALAKYKEFAPLLKDAFKEHAEAKLNLGNIAAMDPATADWKKQVQKLFEDIQHHIKDEEEKLFPKVQKVMEAAGLAKLGAELKEGKSAILNGSLLSQPHPMMEPGQFAQ